MTKYIRGIGLCVGLLGALAAKAETVLIDENFDDDYTKSVSFFYDGDRHEPHSSIAAIFYSNLAGSTMPWWVCRDTNTSPDKFMASHSYYTEPAESNDWLIFAPVYVPSEGFVLEFDAQSIPLRSIDNLSDLEVYITLTQISPLRLPQEPTFVIEKVPYGKDKDNCEGDWIHYSFPLDQFAGKEIHLNFANLNEDNDILCLDNVKIARVDKAVLSIADIDEFTADEAYTVSATVGPAGEEAVGSYTLTLKANGEDVKAWHGDNITADETFTADVPIAPGQECNIEFVLAVDGQSWVQTATGAVTRLAFEPVHRVMVEETTSLKCGNCPMAIYTFDEILNDPTLGDRFLPVSVHIPALGFDPMCTESYYSFLPQNNAAPLVFVERATDYDSFIPAYDLTYDPENVNSFAYRMAQHIAKPTYLDVAVDGQWVIEGADTTAIVCKATVTPAISLSGKDLRAAFILTENNVGLDANPYWIQDNYLSGAEVDGNIGGWRDLPKAVVSLRYHDVARAISEYEGHYGSFPADMTVGESYSYEYTLTIPDTYKQLISAAVQRQFCCLTAIIIDASDGHVVNSARVAMSPVAEDRYTVADMAGISDISADGPRVVSTEWYDLSGRRVAVPAATGVYITRQTLSDGSVRTAKIIRRADF